MNRENHPESPEDSESPMPILVSIQRLPHGHGLALPLYASFGAAGVDVAAAIDAPVILRPMQRLLIPTGFAMSLPPGLEAQIRPRSGLAAKYGVTVLNSPGTIDSDYRGEIKVLLINLGDKDVTIARGDRIAQMVFQPVCQVGWMVVTKLDNTARGDQGFGSTGVAKLAAHNKIKGG